MHGYSDEKYYDTEKVKSEFFHNTTLTKAKKKILILKIVQKKK